MKKSCSPLEAVNRYCELVVSAKVSQMLRKRYGADHCCRLTATPYIGPRVRAPTRVVRITLLFLTSPDLDSSASADTSGPLRTSC